jgi:hypothetical protein
METMPMRTRNNERGIAMIIALFMMLAMSVIGSSLIFVSQSETISSQNYRLMSQARYAAESGIHQTVNYLYYTYAAPTTAQLASYNIAVSPVTTLNGNEVILSGDVDHPYNYPVQGVQTAFNAIAQGSLAGADPPVSFKTFARLKSMRQFIDGISGLPITVQTWELIGTGMISGARAAEVQVETTLEVQPIPIYSYAAFATDKTCAALSFAGGATTNSYNSTSPLGGTGAPVISNSDGNVGTNGNLTQAGNPTTINGSLSTPKAGVGACSANNVNAQTVIGQATLTGGINQLSQEIKYPTPPAPNPTPPTTGVGFTQNGGCPAGIAPAGACAVSANGATITPNGATVVMGDVTINGNADLVLNGGTYVMNSFTMAGSSKLIVPNGQKVIIQIQGENQTVPVTITGDGISNPSYQPQNLQIIYAGTNEIKLAGGDTTSALIYAPNATAAITGGSDLYGAIVVKQLTETGGASIHYDRNLMNASFMLGPPTLSAFTWRSN